MASCAFSCLRADEAPKIPPKAPTTAPTTAPTAVPRPGTTLPSAAPVPAPVNAPPKAWPPTDVRLVEPDTILPSNAPPAAQAVPDLPNPPEPNAPCIASPNCLLNTVDITSVIPPVRL